MKILIATDGSDFSSAAIEKVCTMMSGAGPASIRVVSVAENLGPVAAEPFTVSAEYVRDMEDIARKQASEFVARAEEIIRNHCPDKEIEVESKVIMGAPARTIVEMAQDWKADLIVVGSHGYGFWGRMLLGSVSDAVTHNAPCSVLIVRKNGKQEDQNGNKE